MTRVIAITAIHFTSIRSNAYMLQISQVKTMHLLCFTILRGLNEKVFSALLAKKVFIRD